MIWLDDESKGESKIRTHGAMYIKGDSGFKVDIGFGCLAVHLWGYGQLFFFNCNPDGISKDGIANEKSCCSCRCT